MTIFESIPAIITDIEAIQKTKKEGSVIKYAYRGIDEFMNALNPLLAKHCVTITPDILKNDRDVYSNANGTRMTNVVMHIKYTLTAKDGSSTSGTVIGEAFDSGDKASNKAMSIALKYFIMQVFMVPTEDIDDPDDHDPSELKKEEPKQQTKPTAKPQTGSAPAYVSPAQVARLWAIQRKSNKSIADVMQKMKEKFQINEAEKLTFVPYNELIKWIEGK